MPFMAGNLKDLVERSPHVDTESLYLVVLRQMLHAVACLVSHKLIHRDIKPENILFEETDGHSYHFRLGDFGLSNEVTVARTVAGTEPFMAPEVFNRKTQTYKVDIWSLFATIVWVRNTDGFRDLCNRMSVPDVHEWLVNISRQPAYRDYQTMASRNPRDRPHARDLLLFLNKARSMDNVMPMDGGMSMGGEMSMSSGMSSMQGAVPMGVEDAGPLGMDDLTEAMDGMGMHPADAAGIEYEEEGEGSAGVPYYEPYTDYRYGSMGGKKKGKSKHVARNTREQVSTCICVSTHFSLLVPPHSLPGCPSISVFCYCLYFSLR